jgi:glycosyltransferase involved in cell wall biosynthesis
VGTEVASLGGGSTALYDLFHRAVIEGLDVHLVSALEEHDRTFFRYTFRDELGNPRGLPNTSIVWLTGPRISKQPTLAAHVDAVNPDVMVGFGFYATRLLRAAARRRPLVFVTSACKQAAEYVVTGRVRDAVDLARRLAASPVPLPIVHHGERHAVEQSDLVIAHSPQTLAMMEGFFPSATGKLYPDPVSFGEWTCAGAEAWRDRARPFADRDVDVLVIATDWERPVKNYPLVEALVSALPGVSVHVVGDVARPISGATHHGFLASREALFDLMGRARAVVSPSLIDAAPGILFEASVMGCNVVASKNCGNWEVCHPDLLVDPFGAAEFAAAIRRAIERKYDDRLGALLAQPGYENLIGILTAFTQPFETVSLSGASQPS